MGPTAAGSFVTVFDASTYAILAGIGISGSNGYPAGSAGMSFTPDGALLYVANTSNNNLSVINTATNTVVGAVAAPGGASSVAIGPANEIGPPFTVNHDIDGDGRPDISVYYPAQVGYQYSLQSRPMAPTIETNDINPPNGAFDTVMQADFNGDGFSDMLFYSTMTGAFKVGLGDGNGGFNYAPTITISPGYTMIERGDFNHDGKTTCCFTARRTALPTLDSATGTAPSASSAKTSALALPRSPSPTTTAMGSVM